MRMHVGTGGGGKLNSAINVTPLVDVVLVLLIIFMLVTPMLTRGKDVHLPVSTITDPEQKMSDAIVLTMTADKSLWLENRRITLVALAAELSKRLVESSSHDVLIKADESVAVGDLRPILQKLKIGGVKKVAFAVAGAKGGVLR